MYVSKIADVPDLAVNRLECKVIEQKQWAETGYELLLQRNGLSFEPGRLLTIHGRDVTEDRSYTIASCEQDEHLHILYRYVPTGVLTPQLVKLQAGDAVSCSGPYGQFVLRDPGRPIYFIATGTGIAPCRAYIRAYANLPVTIYHGVRTEEELFFRDEFERFAYHPCLTQEQSARAFQGRVTDCLREHALPLDAHYYLCGAYEMIYDVQALLSERGVPPDHIFAEGYYYRLEV